MTPNVESQMSFSFVSMKMKRLVGTRISEVFLKWLSVAQLALLLML